MKKSMWLQNLIRELGFLLGKATQIWCDNSSSVKIVNNPICHTRIKHKKVHNHFIREKLLTGEIELNHIPIGDQATNIFTKPLRNQNFLSFRNLQQIKKSRERAQGPKLKACRCLTSSTRLSIPLIWSGIMNIIAKASRSMCGKMFCKQLFAQ